MESVAAVVVDIVMDKIGTVVVAMVAMGYLVAVNLISVVELRVMDVTVLAAAVVIVEATAAVDHQEQGQ